MPVFLNTKYPGAERRSGLNWPRVQADAATHHSPLATHYSSLHIGLVNNMGDAAMAATERQFLTLLEAAAGDMLVHVTLYALPEVERRPFGRRRVDSFYSGIDELWELPPEQTPDGLIVTGREPVTADLRDEAYWPSFTRVLAWTQEHARSAIWSCLAAHAAVLALDGIERVRSPHKHFGIFTCEQAEPHALLTGTCGIGGGASLCLPHSRWNGLSASELAAKGYQVLMRTEDGGVDTFVKQDAALFVFFQGHPEYESDTLMGEYRRDVQRYIKGETGNLSALAAGLLRGRDRAISARDRSPGRRIAAGETPRRGLRRAPERPDPERLAQHRHPHLPQLARASLDAEGPPTQA